MGSILGGSKSKSTQQSTSQQSSDSRNQAFPWLQQQYTPMVQNGNQANSSLSALLGLGGNTAGQAEAFNGFRNAAGYQNALTSGVDAIENSRGARGLRESGSTMKRLTEFGQDLGNKYLGQYIEQLLGLQTAGLNAGGLVGGAGQVSTSSGTSSSTGTSTSKSGGGLGSFVGAAATAFSDRRLKEDVIEVGEAYGLPVYEFSYIGSPERHTGFMADEVEVLYPDAVTVAANGYKMVNYGKIN